MSVSEEQPPKERDVESTRDAEPSDKDSAKPEDPVPEEAKMEEKKAPSEDEESKPDWLSVSASWGSNWLKSAKEKTMTTLELVRKDLSEFGDAFANEASALASTTVEGVKHQAHTLQQIVSPEAEERPPPGGEPVETHDQKGEEKIATSSAGETTPSEAADGGGGALGFGGWTAKLPQQLSSGGWVKSLVETVKSIAQEDTTADEDEHTEAILPRSLSEKQKLTRKTDLTHHVLYSIQTDRETYLTPPDGDEHLFALWLDDFRINEYDREISALLSNCPPMRALYQELVPASVSNAVFWERYFYKVYQAEMIERYKQAPVVETLSVSTDLAKGEKKDKRVSECSPDRHSNADETWSVCSSTNIEIQEIHDDLEGGGGSVTPRASDSPKSPEKSEKNGDGWVDWEE